MKFNYFQISSSNGERPVYRPDRRAATFPAGSFRVRWHVPEQSEGRGLSGGGEATPIA